MAGKIGFRSRAGAAFALAWPGLQAAWAETPARAIDTRAGGDEHHRWLHGGLRSSGVYTAGKRADGVSVDVDMLIYRQMHYRDFYGKTVQLEFIVPMSRTTQEAPGAPQVRHRRRDAGFGHLACQQRPDQDLVRLGALHHGAGGPLRRLASGRVAGQEPLVDGAGFLFVQGVGESTFLEAIAEVEIYGRNTDWFGQTPEEGSVAAPVRAGLDQPDREHYTGVRYRYETGGRERSGGQTVTSRARNHQLALELTHQINPSNQIQLQYIHDLGRERPRMRVQMRYVYAF